MLLLPPLLTHLCSHSPVLVRCLLPFARSHSPAPVRPLSSAHSCLCSLALPHLRSPALVRVHVPSRVCPHSFVCVFRVAFAGSHLHALVRVCRCSCRPLSCCRSCRHVLLSLVCTLPSSVCHSYPPSLVRTLSIPSLVLTSLVPTHPCSSPPALVHAAHAFVRAGT